MNSPATLTRREVLARLGILLGGTLIGGEAWLRAAPVTGKPAGLAFSADDLALLDEVAETIIPQTGTPGAKAAGVGAFMARMVTDCYDQAQHATFRAGLDELRAGGFLAASPAERTVRLNALDAEQKRRHATAAPDAPAHYFRMMKQLAVLGYFTSEIGASQVLVWEDAPGRFDGNAPYRPGDRYSFTFPSRNL